MRGLAQVNMEGAPIFVAFGATRVGICHRCAAPESRVWGGPATARSFTLPSHQSPAAHDCHGSVADELSLGGKIPANSNSVFTSRQSPFRARGIARAAFCNSRCSVAEGGEEGDTLEAGAGWVAGEGAFGCGTGGVGAAQDSFAEEGVRATRVSLADKGTATGGGSGCGSGSVAP